jgi:DNA-binding XRE family transcriptional regulator
MSELQNTNVTDKLQIYSDYNEIVTKLIAIRKEANFSQQYIADWLGVSRKKINEFEQGKMDFELLIKYANKLSVELSLTIISEY